MSKTCERDHQACACQSMTQVHLHPEVKSPDQHRPELDRRLVKIFVSLLLFVLSFFLPPEPGWLQPAVLLFAYLVVGWEILAQAAANIWNGEIFDENFLMGLATVGAIAIGEFPEAVAVMLFFQIGEYFQTRAVDRSRRSIAALLKMKPDHVTLEIEGERRQVPPESVSVGERILILPGERIPLDSQVIQGVSTLDMSALTGESMPQEVGLGSELPSGCINLDGVLTAVVTRPESESTLHRILELVEHATAKKSVSEQFITRFARVYTPVVVLVALLLALVPPLVSGRMDFQLWVYRALTFLVVSCPCALVVSIPLTFFGGLGGASRQGILIKGGNYLEALAGVDQVVFDKTGTLTHGHFAVREIRPEPGWTAETVLQLAAAAESGSNHPIARSLREAARSDQTHLPVSDIREEAGFGVTARVDGREISVGNTNLLRRLGVAVPDVAADGTGVYVAVDGVFAGSVVLSDQVKADAARAVSSLHQLGVRDIFMLTGDQASVAAAVAAKIGVDHYLANLLPADKVDQVEQWLANKPRSGKLAFVGDGVNDAPVLARADIGVAMGGLGSDAAIEAADVVIMNDQPSRLPLAIRISRKTMAIARQNAVFAIGIKLLVLLLSAFGLAQMWAAVFADVGVTLLAVLNAMRALQPVADR